MIIVFKYLKSNYSKDGIELFFESLWGRTRNNGFKEMKFRLKVRRNFLT